MPRVKGAPLTDISSGLVQKRSKLQSETTLLTDTNTGTTVSTSPETRTDSSARTDAMMSTSSTASCKSMCTCVLTGTVGQVCVPLVNLPDKVQVEEESQSPRSSSPQQTMTSKSSHSPSDSAIESFHGTSPPALSTSPSSPASSLSSTSSHFDRDQEAPAQQQQQHSPQSTQTLESSAIALKLEQLAAAKPRCKHVHFTTDPCKFEETWSSEEYVRTPSSTAELCNLCLYDFEEFHRCGLCPAYHVCASCYETSFSDKQSCPHSRAQFVFVSSEYGAGWD
eukprot:m.356687 g.356687  ORF g.356687 m.356687 type:complete len:280 (+) comp17601_c0_seq1:369-1208(+)